MTDETITSLMFTRDASELLKYGGLKKKEVRIPKLNLKTKKKSIAPLA